jgi:hypothetical protein
MAESEVISLDSMNPKQKAKEYKATQKDVKSKDLVVKSAALKKLHDLRYYTEGGCLVPLVNSSLPKKVAHFSLGFFHGSFFNDTVAVSLHTENNGCFEHVPGAADQIS